MAFGRSNSLSLNTGATNTLFAQQTQNNPSTQPPAPGGLFGSSTQQSTQAGSLFGGAAAQQQLGGGGLFGASTSQPQQSAGLFGNTTSQPQQTGALFGNTQNNAQGPLQSGGGGLFGSSLAPPAQQPQQSGGLFGSSLNQATQQPQQQQTGSLFGGSLGQSTQQPQQQQSGGLFSNLNQPAQQQQQSGGLFSNTQSKPNSLFGSSTTPAPAFNTSLFGNNTQQQQQNNMSQQQQQPQNSIFGLLAQAPTSLLTASQYRAGGDQSFPLAGRLTMGQQQQPPTNTGIAQPQQQPTQSAVKISFEEMRPTTRFADCIDEIKTQLENIDKMIQAQERFCREIEAFVPKHGEDVESLRPDVDLVKEKADAVEGSLAVDAQGIMRQRDILDGDRKDVARCERVVGNLSLPGQYRYTGHHAHQGMQLNYSTSATSTNVADRSPDAGKEMDLISAYFLPLTTNLKSTLDTYASNLEQIEQHVGVLEQAAVGQARDLAAKRAGVNGGNGGGEQTVRELADTLRGFEAGILGTAGLVGRCREGVNELVLGRLGGGVVGRR